MPLYAMDDEFLLNEAKNSGLFPASIPSSRLPESIDDVVKILGHMLEGREYYPTVRDELCDVVDHMAGVDWLLFVAGSHHRTHLFHQVRVGLIADWLLRTVLLRTVFEAKHSRTLRTALWCASLLHDHAYPLACLTKQLPAMFPQGTSASGRHALEMFGWLRRCYAALFAPRLLDTFCKPAKDREGMAEQEKTRSVRLRKFADAYLCRRAGLEADLIQRLCRPPEGHEADIYDHGLWSALNLAVRISYSSFPWDEADQAALVPLRYILHSIAIHNRDDFAGSDFAVTRNPLAAALAIADELQEWNRWEACRSSVAHMDCRVTVDVSANSGLHAEFDYEGTRLSEANSDTGWKNRVVGRLNGAEGVPKVTCSVKP